MNIKTIVGELNAERDRINRAIAAIEGLNSTGHQKRRGRPPGSSSTGALEKRRRHHMSAEARKRISLATKRRWAAWRKKRAKTS